MSDQDLEKVDSGRRDFLKKSIVAGAVVWGAPAVTSLPGGRAWAQTYGCPDPAGPCVTNAYGLQITVPAIGTLTFPGAPGPSPTCVINPTVPGIINLAATICGDVGDCTASGYIENLDLDILGALGIPILSLQATVLRATATTTGDCVGQCATAGSSVIAGLVINGGAINVTSPCNTVIPVVPALPIASLALNEQTCTGDTLTVNALNLTIPSLGIQVIAGHAEAGREGCTCTTCA